MKRVFGLFASLFVLFSVVESCCSGNYVSKAELDRIELPGGVLAVKVSGAISVTVSTDAEVMTVEGDSLALESFKYSFSDGVLWLGRKSSCGKIFGPGKDCGKISVVIPQTAGLSSVTLSGASRFMATESLEAERISVCLSGASRFVAAEALDAEHIFVDLSGASSLKAEVKADFLTVDASGASSAVLSGAAGEVSYDVSGASRVSSSDAFVSAGSASIDVSGASNVKLACSGVLSGSVSGASRVICYGDCTSRLHVTGASSVKTGR